MTKAFGKVMSGLDDARAYMKGARRGFEVYEVEMLLQSDVVLIRGKAESSYPQKEFATRVGSDHKENR